MNKDIEINPQTLKHIASDLAKLQVERETYLRATKGRFNLFTLLRNSWDETGLHSKYLADLLNPAGSHDCGSMFLKLLLNVLKTRGVKPHDEDATPEVLERLDDFNFDSVEVKYEHPTPNGRLDILLISSGWGMIAIENKIWAQEQDHQIERYATYLKSARSKSVLLYLTLNGKASDTACDQEYYRISYCEHILLWLEECLRATYPHVGINQALQQYKNVICQLVGRGTLEVEYMAKTIEIIQRHPDILIHLNDINDATRQLMDERRNTLFKFAISELQKKQYTIRPLRGHEQWPSFGITAIKDQPPIFEESGMELRVELWRSQCELYIGVSTHCCQNAQNKYRAQLQALNIQLVQRYGNQHGEGTWEGWLANRLILIKPCFDSPKYLMSLLQDKDRLQKDIEDVVKDIEKYVTCVDAIWKEVCPKA